MITHKEDYNITVAEEYLGWNHCRFKFMMIFLPLNSPIFKNCPIALHSWLYCWKLMADSVLFFQLEKQNDFKAKFSLF